MKQHIFKGGRWESNIIYCQINEYYVSTTNCQFTFAGVRLIKKLKK
jgi:hypothetical protein